MQSREQIDAVTVTRVVLDRGSYQRARVANDHQLATETLGQQIIDALRSVRATCRDSPEPSRRPRGWLSLVHQSLHLDQGSRHLILGQLLDQAVELVAGGGHDNHHTSRQPLQDAITPSAFMYPAQSLPR